MIWEIGLLKFPIPIVLDLTGCRKYRIFCGKCLKIRRKLHGGDRKHSNVCKKKKHQNLKNDRWVIFHPYANFSCPYLKIGLCDLQWRNFARGCPWARDGWVPHWLTSACAKCKKLKRATRASLAAWGPGARLRAPVGSRGKALDGDAGGEALGSSCAFQCRNSISHANL